MSNKAELDKQLFAMRHSLAHIMATAIEELYPGVKFGVGPVIENGFYYDIDTENRLGEDDLIVIESKMRDIIKSDYPFVNSQMELSEAYEYFKSRNQTYKMDLIDDLRKHGTTVAGDIDREQLGIDEGQSKVDSVSLYTDGPFTDLCRGPHVESTGKVGAFKLLRISGAYWRGDDKNDQLQRIYGVGFTTKKELESHLHNLAEAEKRDHRKLGSQLDVYMNSDLVGSGLPLLLPNGEIIKHELMEYMRHKEVRMGYKYVSTPHLAHEDLYKASGHAEFYTDDMYSIVDEEGNKFYLKPMNCPHHHMIYGRLAKSYRDLPLKLAENTGLYRHELSGTLTGLIRVRGPISQNDAHIYVSPEMLKGEFVKVLELFTDVYKELGIEGYWFRLSLPDFNSSKDKFSGDKSVWEMAGAVIREALEESGVDFIEAEGEAAFYGPKLDVQIKNVSGREDTIATSQIDILVPERMGLKYIDKDGKEGTPIVIHRSILGSYERFMGFLLEQTTGALPLWLSPEQVRLAPINDTDKIIDYTNVLKDQLELAGIRVGIDASVESVGKKIREAGIAKIPYTLIIGDKEVTSKTFSPRLRIGHGNDPQSITLETFIDGLNKEIADHSLKSIF